MSLLGVSIIIEPFEADPLFKELEAMAKLAGAEITYPDKPYLTGNDVTPTIAEYLKDGSGWRFLYGPHLLTGKSLLFPVAAPWPSGNTNTHEEHL